MVLKWFVNIEQISKKLIYHPMTLLSSTRDISYSSALLELHLILGGDPIETSSTFLAAYSSLTSYLDLNP